ncbi:MAG: UrcA family protein [Asticcacaulis sp.]|nr:UrcA family protein [Asticcacaulis sp.]
MSRSIFIAALSFGALSFAALAAGAANAQERRPAEVVVTAKHLDFTNAREARTFYTRLKAAAKTVCTSAVYNSRTAMEDEACEDRALTNAVEDINAPQLSALHGHPDRATAYAERNTGSRRN